MNILSGFPTSLVLPQVMARSWAYHGHGGEGIGGKELWLWCSEVQIELQHGANGDCLPSTGSLPTATIPVSSMLRFNLNFRLIWMWKNQRRQKNRRILLKVPWHASLWMLSYRCWWAPFTVFKDSFPKFSHGAELQPLRASPTMSIPPTDHLEAHTALCIGSAANT